MLNVLLEQVKNAIFSSKSTPHQQDHDPDGLIDQISGLFGRHQEQYGTMQNPRPASEDPYGDPADLEARQGYGGQGVDPRQQFPNVRPASEDPYGDPADREPGRNYAQPRVDPRQQFPNLRPASEDPYGDPADR